MAGTEAPEVQIRHVISIDLDGIPHAPFHRAVGGHVKEGRAGVAAEAK